MKIRNGFVSNSSSSSFVVAWPKKPATSEEMGGMLFGDVKEYPNPYSDFDGRPAFYPMSDVSGWLMESLIWGEREVRESLAKDWEPHIEYLIRSVAEKCGNSYTLEDNSFVSCLTLARKELKQIINLLKKRYSRVDWEKRVDTVMSYQSKWHKIKEKLAKDLYTLQEKISKEKDYEKLSWQDTSKMTKEQKAAYDKASNEDYEQLKTLVFEDPRYKKADEHRRKVSHKTWQLPKKMTETILLMSERMSDIFFADNKGSAFSVVEIHDDTSLGSALEHGTLFDNLPHKRFSHH